jgi:hypothetical protein
MPVFELTAATPESTDKRSSPRAQCRRSVARRRAVSASQLAR